MASPSTELPAQNVTEGSATVCLPPSVFYNPVQEFNRDLTIAVISEHVREFVLSEKRPPGKQSVDTSDKVTDAARSCVDRIVVNNSASQQDEEIKTADGKTVCDIRKVRILEGLAASGLRSVRFALEIPHIREVVANDFDQTAVEYIRQNAKQNHVDHLLTASCSDAAMLMYASRSRSNRFDVVDLDPYGSPAPFLDSAVQCISDGGLLCVTCTDMAVLCGNAAETCRAKYGAVSIRAPYCHEMALRIILQSIAGHAARYQRFIKPVLSISADFYVRVFVRIWTGQSHVKEMATNLANVYHCRSCGVFSLQPLMTRNRNLFVIGSGPPVAQTCEHCGGKHAFCGPIWSAPIHDVEFVKRVRESVCSNTSLFPKTRQRIDGTLSVVCEELEDEALYYVGDALCSVLHCTSPGFIPLRSALLHAGYKVSLSHAHKSSLKTNAPASVIWDIMRCWVSSHPVSESRLQDGSTAKAILSKPAKFSACFDPHPDANPPSRAAGLVRWQMNPDRNWGPKPRAVKTGLNDSVEDRRLKGAKKAEETRMKRKTDRNLKQFPCKKHREGCCDLGEQCRYLHDDAKISDAIDITTD